MPGAKGAPEKSEVTKPAGVGVVADDAAAAVPDPDGTTQWDVAAIKADQAIEVNPGSKTVVVGVLDSGIDATHPDLAGQVDLQASVNWTAAGRAGTAADGW